MSKIKFIKTSVFFLLFCLSISSQDYDILIQNGHVIDLKNKIDDVYDIAISKNKIVSVDKKLNAKNAKRVIDASGLIVVPGLIDIHSHNFHGTIPNRYLSNSFSLSRLTKKLPMEEKKCIKITALSHILFFF